ncbi:carboxypeptidase-like regulatory domain-containing protein [Ekhidna sp.]
MRITLISFFIFLSLCGYSQRNYLYGVVTDSASADEMIGVHIRNLQAGLLTNTNPNGTFKIPVQPGDSLELTYVGYKSLTYVIPNGERTEVIYFHLSPAATQLAEVEVNVFPEYWRFKQLIIDSQPIDSSLVVFGLDAIPLNAYDLPANETKVRPPDYHAPAIAISFDMGGLTKKGKEQKKLQKILAQKEMERVAYRKFSRDWVAAETELTGDELTDFIAFCKFTPKYLIETSLFDIHENMMALLEEFKEKKSDSGNHRYNPGA